MKKEGIIMQQFKLLSGLLIVAMCCSACASLVGLEERAAFKAKTKILHYNKERYPLQIENMNVKGDKEISTYNKPPARVITVWSNNLETLLALGLGDRVVAAMGAPPEEHILPEYREQFRKIPVKTRNVLSIEDTLMLEPEVILAWHSTFGPKVLRSTDFWHGRGINTYISPSSAARLANVKTLDTEMQDILNLGKIFDREDRAKEIVAQIQGEIDKVTTKTSNYKKRPRALIIELLGKEPRVYGNKSLAGNILKKLNGELLAAELMSIGYEEIVDLNPDVIFLIGMGKKEYDENVSKKKIMEHKALRNMDCIKAGRLHVVPLYTVYTSGVRSLEGIKILSKGLYPELTEK